METIVREVHDAYRSIEKGKEKGFNGYVFAEEHVHSVLGLVTNKDITSNLDNLQQSICESMPANDSKDNMFSVINGSDISIDELFTNKDKVEELSNAIQECIAEKDNFGFIVQFGVLGNHQKDTVKIAASQLQLPCVFLHREDVIAKFARECEPHVNAAFTQCHNLHETTGKPVILYIENLDGIVTNVHASPAESLKRKNVEQALCKQLKQLKPSDQIIVIANSEAPFSTKNELQDLQKYRIFYNSPTKEERCNYIQSLISMYDNCLSEYMIQYLMIHTSCFSLRQLHTLFEHAYLIMLVCKYTAMNVQDVIVSCISKAEYVQAISQFIQDYLNHNTLLVPSIPDHILQALLEKEKPSYSVVDISRASDWCRSLNRPSAEMHELENMIKILRERDEVIRKADLNNMQSREPVERRQGEAYVMNEVKEDIKPDVKSEVQQETKSEGTKVGSFKSSTFGHIMEAKTLNTQAAEDYREQMERKAKEEAERMRLQEQRNLEERERMRLEEQRRQKEEEERRKAEFEAQKRKEEERQRRLEAKLAAEEEARNRKIQEQRRIHEEAARRRQEEIERREEERRRQEQEELERKEQEREALVARRREQMQEELRKKEQQNQREAEEQMRRFEEERRRIYQASMGFDQAKYQASTERLNEEKSAEEIARENDQRKREEAIKKAREQMAERLEQEKLQRKMERDVYKRLAELKRPAPESKEEKIERIGEARHTIAEAKKRIETLLALKDEVKEIVEIRRKKQEEERKKREEEEERKRKEEEERREKKRKEEEEERRRKKAAEEEAKRIAAEKRKAELDKEREEMRKRKAEEAHHMEERLLSDELRLLDCREKMYHLKQLLKDVKSGHPT